jgi:CRISPR system Cascade subunit CasD
MKRHLILRFDAPLVAFGGVAVDNYGVTDAWPSPSLLTGLLANALGYRRIEAERLQDLQDRLVFACRCDRAGEALQDFQTAELKKDDKGWTTRGAPEGRDGGAGTYVGKHIRYRDYWADRIVTVALRLAPENAAPSLDDLGAALDRPARPLFIGRKPCLPAARLLVGEQAAETALAAVMAAAAVGGEDNSGRLFYWPAGEAAPPMKGQRRVTAYGLRNWRSGVHGGTDHWYEGMEP